MNTQDLIAGYAAYTDASELGPAYGDAPAITPTGAVSVSTPLCPVTSVSVTHTVDQAC